MRAGNRPHLVTNMAHALHQSLVVPNLVCGAERPLAIAVLITSAALILGVGIHWQTLAIAAVLLTFGLGGLRLLAKYDPQFSKVYARHRAQQDIYPATGTITPKRYPIFTCVPSRTDIAGWKLG